MYQILLLLFFYFLVLYSILGYGRVFTLINSNYQATSFDGLVGVVVLILISYSSNIFFPHNYLHNSIVIIFGFFIFIYDLKINYSKRVKDNRDISLIFLIIFIGMLMYKNHDDFYIIIFHIRLFSQNLKKYLDWEI